MTDDVPSYPRTIARSGQHEIEIKKSRFICTLAQVAGEAEARSVLERVRKEHWSANHNCYAWSIGERGALQKASDDGEPGGTAGVPMLEVLKRRHLIDTLAIVTRYFGGTKLGAGGLIRAYGQAVSETIDVVGIVERRPLELLAVRAPYDLAGRIENALRASPHPPAEIDYGADAIFTVRLEPDEVVAFRAWLAELTGGRCTAEVTGRVAVEVPI
ncbi:MAG: YigZ family protein [Thermomicrobiales bacterium]|nr:YigZ family protein [Thermomicrobiales bacterium]